MSSPTTHNPNSNKLGIGPGTRKHADVAAFPGTPAKNTMRTQMPLGVSERKTEIVESLPEEFASTLPSIELLEAEL